MHASFPLARAVLGSIVFSAAACLVHAAKWPAVIPAELAETKGRIDPDAGVEVLESVTVIDQADASSLMTDVYVRLKVFTAQGVDKMSKVEIPFDRTAARVSGIEARTTKPDGSTVELKSKDVFEREVVKGGGVRVHVKSFAPPGLEPGAIVEYRCSITNTRGVGFFPLVFQDEYPARSVTYRFRPFGMLPPGFGMQALFMGYPKKELTPSRDGYYEFTMTNQAAKKDEIFGPPQFYRRAAVLLYYTFDMPKTPERYWAKLSGDLLSETKSKASASKAIKAEAARLIAGATSHDEKLQRLHDFCRGEIRNTQRDGSHFTKEQRAKLKRNDDADDTLQHRYGNSEDIQRLFVALATAAGFDARLARANDRTVFVHENSLAVPFAFTHLIAAVRRGESWTFFEPGDTYLPPATIAWQHGDTSALVANEKTGLIVSARSAPAERSVRHQSANLTVNDDGSLEGDVALDYTGYFETTEKNALDAATPDEIEKHLLATIEPHLKGAEITAIKVENADKALAPLKVTYHLKVPDFAERTGSRLFVQPNVFHRGDRALFEAEKRETTILFPHRYREVDEITVTLPEGFELEAGAAPPDIDLGGVGKYQVEIRWSPKRRAAIYRREFQLNAIGFPSQSYPGVKRMFEIVHERDNHTLTFHQAETKAEGQP
jgi:hypothetical protein